MVTGGPKWNAHRTLAASRTLLDLLAGALQQRGVTGVDREALLFVGAEGGPLHYINWPKGVSLPACQAVGLGDLRFQALRTANTTAHGRIGRGCQGFERHAKAGRSAARDRREMESGFPTSPKQRLRPGRSQWG
jgi:hypothetical protein